MLCMKQMMVDIAHTVEEYFPGDTVLLVHDHGSWDDAVQEGYNLMIDEPDWVRCKLFEGLVSKTGKDPSAVGLQAADMFAYEVFKGIKAKNLSPDSEMRPVMKEFTNQRVPMCARWINLPAAQALYRIMKDSGKYPDLDSQGVA